MVHSPSILKSHTGRGVCPMCFMLFIYSEPLPHFLLASDSARLLTIHFAFLKALPLLLSLRICLHPALLCFSLFASCEALNRLVDFVFGLARLLEFRYDASENF